MRKQVCALILLCIAVAACRHAHGPGIPSWARPDDAQLTHVSDCPSDKEQCSVEYLTNVDWQSLSDTLADRFRRRRWSVRQTGAGLGATQFLYARPPDARTCLYYSFIPNTVFGQPVPSVEAGREWIADDIRLRSAYRLIVSITARRCDLAVE